MDTVQALRDLNVRPDDLTDQQRWELDERGYFAVENVLSAEECQAMGAAFDALSEAERGQGGHEVHIEPGARRVSNIFNKSDAFDHCLELPPVLAAAHYLLGDFKVHGANLRDPQPGGGQQELHADVPKHSDTDWWVLNAMILFDDMTEANGPTRVIPGSHRWAPYNVAAVNQGDWEPKPLSAEDQARVPTDPSAAYPGEVIVTAPAGSAVIANSSMWHSGTGKREDLPRRMLHLTYTRRDLPQQLLQLDYLTPELYERMSPAQRYLLEIEPKADGEEVLRQPERAHGTWWN
ncbi:MAG: phytanoyl-CoA dioxygenase family protein [Pseudomonadota bacterium]